MNTRNLEKFAQDARRQLREQVKARLAQVLRTDSVELREKEKAVAELKRQIAQTSQAAVIETVAYTWFNRFCALRFMDVNRYTRLGIVSPVAGFTQPEMLQEAKQRLIDESWPIDHQRVFDLLDGRSPASHPQAEAYRLLLVAACNAYHKEMPFLFEPIEDYTELLMPADLLSENSILHAIRTALTPDNCHDVEIIGWLYQFYIAERKDEVFAGLKKGKKIQPQDIPAATQLFTPHWIVRYLVENSLGRLWLQNRPHSRLAEVMEYYIADSREPLAASSEPLAARDEELAASSEPLAISENASGYPLTASGLSPEDIKICDPACGSGHMLTYAFDLLYHIYEEEGYEPAQIPRLIVEKNLTGLEIDARAAALAAFALTMKARAKDRRFFRRGVTPHIVLLEPVRLTPTEIDDYMTAVGRDLFTQDFEATLTQFEQADNFGALIRPQLQNAAEIRQRLVERGLFENLFLHATHQQVLQVLDYTKVLSRCYHVVIANPPYMGTRGMNDKLKAFARSYYPDSKGDAYTMFIERNLDLAIKYGFVGMITIPSWMFLSSFETLREKLLANTVIGSLVHNGRGVWGSDFGSCSFILNSLKDETYLGAYKRLSLQQGKVHSNEVLSQRLLDHKKFPIYQVSGFDLKKIPGLPIAFWVSSQVRSIFDQSPTLGSSSKPRQGMASSDDKRFVRVWMEIEFGKVGLGYSDRMSAKQSQKKWFPYDKGGVFRKWYGNNEYVVNWEKDGQDVLEYAASLYGSPTRTIKNISQYFKEGITWTAVTSGTLSVRFSPPGHIFSNAGMKVFHENHCELIENLAFLNSILSRYFVSCLSQTLNFDQGVISRLPVLSVPSVKNIADSLVSCSKIDWDSYETSWDFTILPLLRPEHRCETLAQSYAALRQQWQEMTLEMQRLEEENNRIFIEAYGLQDELTPEVPLSEITLTCNPAYRYGGNKDEAALEARLREDTMKEFISYAVGCMLGRYSLDKPGLILANQGQTAADYLAQIPQPTFPPDEDNVIPILDEGWFNDDIVERFKTFLRLTFGPTHYEDNLAFIESALGKDIRSYFLRDFYSDHVKTYKKRPIYWLFSSPNGSFNALISMHRYRPDTLSIILNDYLREYRLKLTAHQAHLAQVSLTGSSREKTWAIKESTHIDKILAELKSYEDDILYPLATRKLEIDLDDGVKVNYEKFGKALKKI